MESGDTGRLGRKTDRQKTETDRKIHGIAPEDSPIPPRHMAPRDSDRTEPELARTQMNEENGVFVLGEGWGHPSWPAHIVWPIRS